MTRRLYDASLIGGSVEQRGLSNGEMAVGCQVVKRMADDLAIDFYINKSIY